MLLLTKNATTNYRRPDLPDEERKKIGDQFLKIAEQFYAVLPALERDVCSVAERNYFETFHYRGQEKWVIIALAVVNVLLAIGADSLCRAAHRIDWRAFKPMYRNIAVAKR